MSSLDQKTLSLDTRLNVTFTPTMTLELFAQPFIASGRFFDFKEFDAPRSVRKSVYGRDRGTITPITYGVERVSQYQIDPDGAVAATFLIDNPDFNTRSLRGNVYFGEYLLGIDAVRSSSSPAREKPQRVSAISILRGIARNSSPSGRITSSW